MSEQPTTDVVSPVAILPVVSDSQAALFDDPVRLLAVEVSDLRKLAVAVAHDSGSVLARVRRANGLIAWAMWHQLSELAYAEWERDHAAELDTPAPTLRRWRRDVVAAGNLAMPATAAVRSDAAKKSLDARKSPGQAPSAATNGSKVGAPKIPPGPGVTEAVAVATAARRLPDPGPPASVRASVAHLIDHLHALDPDEAGRAMTAAQLDVAMDWMEHAAKAAPRRAQVELTARRATRPPKSPSARGNDCTHPITRRLGTGCGACGVDPVPK
jgi:hypothetical protein